MTVSTITRPPVQPIADLDRWATRLAAIARQPLEFCPEFPRIAQRYEAWWHQAILDRPIIQLKQGTNPGRQIYKRTDMIGQPERWFAEKFQDMRDLRCLGDGLPALRADFGPVLVGGLLGGRMEFTRDTSWTHPFINDDWSNAPAPRDGRLDTASDLWKRFVGLSTMVAKAAAGRFVAVTPDLGGSGDVMLNLRGSEALCLDVLEQPQVVRRTIDAIYPAWRQAYTALYDIAVAGQGAPLVHWLEIWSNRPYMIPACDFNALIGPREFENICLPDIARQTATVGRAVFHLDGPDAAKHVDALLEVPDIQAIQFVPGDGTPSQLRWVPMLQKIQARGRSLILPALSQEVLTLAEQLRPEGLAFQTWPADPEALLREFGKRYGMTG